MRILLILGIPVLAVIAAIAMSSFRQEPPKNDRIDLDPLVAVIELEAMAANFEVGSQGTVRPRTETILSAEVSGTITSISPKFIAGGVFQPSEVLMRIDPTNYKVAVDQAEALVLQRQIEYDGAKKLKSQGYRAEAEFASAAAALATANAEQVRARRNLERTFIRLPYEGIVRAKEADLGQFVNPGTRLGVTFATDYAEIRLPLTDQDLAFVDLPGASAVTASGTADGPAVTLTAVQKGQPVQWQATIVRTEGVVDEKSRVTYAVARVNDPYQLHSDGSALPMGTFVSASIDGTLVSEIFRVPNSAVRGADRLLFIDEDNTLRIRSVDIIRSDSEYSYLRGASEGERIVTSALETPINGMSVRTAGESTDTASQVATVTEGDD
ncbi:MAG: efflux RND transporter periplasmic adaptor subunit [Woeseiaceae bacterium]